MVTVIKALYNCSFTIWNTLIDVAMTLFTTSPKVASGGAGYAVARNLYNAISDATAPIAAVFFLIALYKTVVSAPPEQQAQRFLMDALRYVIILYMGMNAWKIMGYVMDFADGVTAKIGTSGNYHLSLNSTLLTMIEESLKLPDFELSGEWFSKVFDCVGYSALFLISGVAMIFIMVACSLSIISSAFQRIIKPLLIIPFAGIAVALGAGGHEISRSLVQYVKTFFGFCISGALMVISVKVGVTLCTTLINIGLTGTDVNKCILMSVQACITPIVISGLVKTCDHIADRMF